VLNLGTVSSGLSLFASSSSSRRLYLIIFHLFRGASFLLAVENSLPQVIVCVESFRSAGALSRLGHHLRCSNFDLG
jgi:hypothetical protein